MNPRWLCAGASALALSAAALPGAAQEPPERGVALERFNPAPAGDRMFGVPTPMQSSPNQDGSPTPHAMLLVDYARNPLVLTRESSGEDIGAVVSDHLFLHLSASLLLWDTLHLNADLPFALLQSGESPSADGVSFTSPSSADIGDLRLGARLRVYGDYFDPFQVAFGGYLWVPTGNGDAGSYVGEGAVRGQPHVIVGGRIRNVIWTTSMGVDLRPSQDFLGVQQGTMLLGGAGVGFLVDQAQKLQLGPELSLSSVVEDATARNLNAELLLGGRYRFLPNWETGLGAGPGLTRGLGTPQVRVVAMVAYTPEVNRPLPDRDRDGIPDQQDACPDVAGKPDPDPAKHGCPPPPDRDGDGVPDAQDACPDLPGLKTDDPTTNGCPGDRDGDGVRDDKDACPDAKGPATLDPETNGCPPPSDRDGDGVPDAQDACPDIPGLRTADPATNGCPGDRDRDTIRDDKDACPNEKGKPDPDPAKNGCPVAVRVTDQEIVILQRVEFDTAKATIKKVSDPLLDEVAQALKDHPEIMKLEVQGHTDSRGGKAYNKKLSQDRADSVMKALVGRGIVADRVTAKGYGPDEPIADNATAEGRQKNRRVQFKILEKKAQP